MDIDAGTGMNEPKPNRSKQETALKLRTKSRSRKIKIRATSAGPMLQILSTYAMHTQEREYSQKPFYSKTILNFNPDPISNPKSK